MTIPYFRSASVKEVIEITSGLGLFFQGMTSDDVKNYLEIKPSSIIHSNEFTAEVLDGSVEMTVRSTSALVANKIDTIRDEAQLTARKLIELERSILSFNMTSRTNRSNLK